MNAAENRAVFLSYASQDAETVRVLAEALRAAGVEVWFDQNELVGGDAWDAKIRGQIASCTLFIPIISVHTQARLEGYFRIEWKLAAQRTHAMAEAKPFLLPVVIDDTRDTAAHVPAEFRAVQWTRLAIDRMRPGAIAVPAFCARAQQLLDDDRGARTSSVKPTSEQRGTDALNGKTRSPIRLWALIAAAGAAVVAMVIWHPWTREHRGTPTPAAMAGEAFASSPEVAELIGRVWKLVDYPGRGRSDLEAADELCKRAASLEPTNPHILAAWAHVDAWLIFLKMDSSAARREAGRARARRAVQLAPEAFDTRLAWASFQIFDPGNVVPENAPEIERSLRALLRERPGDPRAVLAVGFLQRFAGQFAESRRTFEELTRNPTHAAVGWCEIAYVHVNALEYAAAETALDASLARQTFFWNLSQKAQLALWWHGDLDAAVTAFKRVPREALREDHGFELAMWVHTMRRDGAAMLRLLENTPRDWIGGWSPGPKAAYAALAYTFLGRTQAAVLERTAALRLVERKLAETPNSRDLLLWKGTLLADQGEPDEALRLLQLAQEISGGNEAGALALQVALRRFDAAMTVLEAWERDPARTDLPVTAAFMRHHWGFDPLRSQPRFQALQARLDVSDNRRTA